MTIDKYNRKLTIISLAIKSNTSHIHNNFILFTAQGSYVKRIQ
jgi:hypothetical protein